MSLPDWNPHARLLDPTETSSRYPYMIADPVELTGYANESHGFIRFRAEGIMLNPVKDVFLHIPDLHNVDFRTAAGAYIGGFRFPDEHPKGWIDKAVEARSAAVIVGDFDSFLNAPTFIDGLHVLEDQHALIGLMPVAAASSLW